MQISSVNDTNLYMNASFTKPDNVFIYVQNYTHELNPDRKSFIISQLLSIERDISKFIESYTKIPINYTVLLRDYEDTSAKKFYTFENNKLVLKEEYTDPYQDYFDKLNDFKKE